MHFSFSLIGICKEIVNICNINLKVLTHMLAFELTDALAKSYHLAFLALPRLPRIE